MSCQKYLFREVCSKKHGAEEAPEGLELYRISQLLTPCSQPPSTLPSLPCTSYCGWGTERAQPGVDPAKKHLRKEAESFPSGSLCSCNTNVTEGGKRAVAAWTSTQASIGPHPSALSPLGFGTVQAGAGRPCSDPAHAAAVFLSCQRQHLCSWSFLLYWLGFQPYQSSRGILLAYASARRGRNTQPSARRVLNSRFRWRWKAAQGQIWGAEGLDRFCDRFTQRILMYL